MRRILIAAAAAMPLLTGGCIAKTAFDLATLPIKATKQVADWTTTSQSESDRNYGRKKRAEEAREGAARRAADKECKRDRSKCDADGDGFRADRGGYNR